MSNLEAYRAFLSQVSTALECPTERILETLTALGLSGAEIRALSRAGEEARAGLGASVVPARVVACHREDQLVLVPPDGLARRGVPTGRLLHTARGSEELPTVGDWVAAVVHDAELATIAAVLPRRGLLARSRPGGGGARQPLAANVDVALIVTSLNRDLNLRRLERYQTLARDGGAQPVIVLSKADLCDEAALAAAHARLAPLAARSPVVVTSAHEGRGIDAVIAHLGVGRTAVLLGSSGVGKSSLTNALLGETRMATRAIRSDDDKGRHTTTHRELVVLPERRGVLIDTPGMRELALSGSDDASDALESTFEDVAALVTQCRFRDCQHVDEPGCAVIEAIEAGELDEARLRGWHKLERELAHERRHELSRYERVKAHQRLLTRARSYRRATRDNPKR